MRDDTSQAFIGTFIDTPSLGQLRIRTNHLLEVNKEGYITSLSPTHLSEIPSQLTQLRNIPIHNLDKYSFLLPTFTDLHLHAPQYLYAGTGLDLPLMEWLERYTYVAEEKIDNDSRLAEKVYDTLVRRLVDEGTGSVVFFGTIGVEANLILARKLLEAGLRGWVGKLSMDQSPRPTYGESSHTSSLNSLSTFISGMEQLTSSLPPHRRLVQPIITPRFVPVCSDELLHGLGKLAREGDYWITSHMCESKDQMDWVEGSRGRRDEEVFDQAGLLGPKTIQAHVTSFPPDLRKLVRERGVTVAHCPLSNAYFSDSQFPLREALDEGISVGLGSDIAGGYAVGIQQSMRQSVITSRLRESFKKEDIPSGSPSDGGKSKRVDWKESLYVATRGGKKALQLGGCWEVGMEFDAQFIRVANDDGTSIGSLDMFDLPEEPDERWWVEAIEKWWCNGTPSNRVGMWVQGNRLA
ncbi:hypothetical protein TREMEDRAFT_33527 [Tremella mesenterica DSM 1558]|uniref:uncharacterized protein n=1 Tax=Tremella mesenterica (strain ATCC 24925 / CBS 8224 / DSM 1558 / NBRC 9311 / NRRL Y-6157 / RJB 2259-6 / UBC 559-6) TaxID=578456 RepID=UPI0003F49823|nr:uncharacterized protein TREMEDRAFT_33527 [Tremella mesenterica DSM 1558]EIW67597.1 hypothetical protein TREMEDRAFT_33527 [Tremella mesenterica DSM 1558]